MRRKTNRRIRPQTRRKGGSGILVLPVVLALSAFGLWRCIEDYEGPLSPAETTGMHRRIDVGAGIDVDTTIVNEQALLEQEAGTRETQAPVPPRARKSTFAEDKDPAEAPAEKNQPKEPPPPIAIPAEKVSAPRPPPFPLHAVAFQFHTQVREKPDITARVSAYARRGATFRVSEKIDGAGCEKGWHEIEPGGYFVCSGGGVIVGREPVSFAPSPVLPKLDADLPYDYRYVSGQEAIQYWRLPNSEEELAAKAALNLRTARSDNLDRDALAAVLAKARAMGGDEEQPETETETGVDNTTDSTAPDRDLPNYVHKPLLKGFYVSVDDVIKSPAGLFARTVRGRFVRQERLAPAKPSAFSGVLLGRNSTLPLGFVVGSGVSFLTRSSSSSALKNDGQAEYYRRVDIGEELFYKGRRYLEVGQGRYLPAKVVAVARLVPPPSKLREGERWIAIDLAEQTLVAYEGERPVFATLVSTGRPGFETPKGTFSIYGKHVSVVMDDTAAGDESYSIEDVPWTQFFKDGFALHAAFWHDRLGRVRSHGCINLSPADARRLFQWTGPHVPPGLHGVIASRENPGTRIVIY
jgi:lipoprotein-anchoring transpeptidase ErfK/SrfK